MAILGLDYYYYLLEKKERKRKSSTRRESRGISSEYCDLFTNSSAEGTGSMERVQQDYDSSG